MGQWQDATSQQVKLITKRLNELLATGVDLLHSELGVDLGLKPELPSWVILLAACLGLVLMVALWASTCRGFFKKQPTIATANDSSESKTPVTKPVSRTEDQKKKKKKADKKAQANGRPVAETQEEEVIVKEETVPHQPEVKTEKASELKKSKKKPKQVAKETKAVTTAVKEPEEGTWETKVSNKEKREQRRKDKTPSDGSASPGGVHTPSVTPTEQPKTAAAPAAAPSPVSAGQRKKKGESTKVKIEKVVTVSIEPQVVSIEPVAEEVEEKEKEEEVEEVAAAAAEVVVAAASGGWSEVASSVPPPIIGLDSWTANQIPEPSNQEVSPCSSDIDGTWTLVDKEESVGSTPDPEVSTAEKPQSVVDVPWLEQPPVDDWSGPKDNLVVSGAGEPSSDWNAPSEEWGNYVEPAEEIAAPQEEQEQPQPQPQQLPEPAKVSDEDKVDPTADGVSKSKKKKKKKKKAEEAAAQEFVEPEVEVSPEAPVKKQPAQETAPAVQPVSAAPPAAVEEKDERPAVKENVSQKAPVTQVPQKTAETEQAEPSAKQDNLPAPVQHKNPEESQVSKPAKKKKARRET